MELLTTGTNIHGNKIKKCKIQYCNEFVNPKARKQHCTKHMNVYNERREECHRVQATLPTCEGGIFDDQCENKIPPSRQGQRYCPDCAELIKQQATLELKERVAKEKADKKAKRKQSETEARLVEYDELDSYKAFHAWLRPRVELGEL